MIDGVYQFPDGSLVLCSVDRRTLDSEMVYIEWRVCCGTIKRQAWLPKDGLLVCISDVKKGGKLVYEVKVYKNLDYLKPLGSFPAE